MPSEEFAHILPRKFHCLQHSGIWWQTLSCYRLSMFRKLRYLHSFIKSLTTMLILLSFLKLTGRPALVLWLWLHQQQIFILLQKSLYNSNQLPLIFGDCFVLNRPIHIYNTRNRSNFHLDSVNTTFGKWSLKFKGTILWNSLPASLREPMSRAKFKK